MSKQEPTQSPSSSDVEGNTGANRYYVQQLTEQIFLVRERLSGDGTPGADDQIIRSFNVLHDAYAYVRSLNNA